MRTYEITYRVIPAGVGPDDYEPDQLEERTGSYQFPDPGPDDHYELDGQQRAYGPSYAAMQAVIGKDLQDGEHAIIGAFHQV